MRRFFHSVFAVGAFGATPELEFFPDPVGEHLGFDTFLDHISIASEAFDGFEGILCQVLT